MPSSSSRLPSTIFYVDSDVGETLAGSYQRLISERPVVCASWALQGGAHVLGILAACGYTRFMWFTDHGELIRSGRGPLTFDGIDTHATTLSQRPDAVCVVAFHGQAELNERALAQLSTSATPRLLEPTSPS
ncbi:MAG TPA: hypothetical protein VFO19_16045 [Vicinamibacterales bacterium]|nr:hypothetical protein [Vicinamibacterales bacterium]